MFIASLLISTAFAQVTSIQSSYSKGELIGICKATIAKTDERLKAIAALKPAARNMDSTMLAMENAMGDMSEQIQPLNFMKNVSPSQDTRDEAKTCAQLIAEFSNDIGTRRDLYLALKDQKGRNADEKRLIEETLKDFERNGMKLPDDQLQKYRALSDKLDQLQLDFANNNNEDKSTVQFKAEDLVGVNINNLAGLEHSGDTLIVPVREPDFVEIQQNATNSETRKKMMLAFYNRGGEANIKLLEQAVLVREEIAKLLGYKTWADYRVENRMAKTSKNVMDFLNGLRGKLSAQNRVEIDELLKFKQTLEPDAKVVNQWDLYYLPHQLQMKRYNVDLEKVREYFPSDVVIPGMMQIYSDMLGVRYKEVANAKVWSPDVKLYEIRDKKDNRLIGFFYLDLYSRPGKYPHAANATLIPGRRLKNGKYNYPIAGIMANLKGSKDGSPPLMTYADRGEVVTLFHEFGHTMHTTLTRAPYSSMSGTSVRRDFVEAPSQMLENWVYRPEILDRLSGHYLDHAKKMPPEMLKSLIELKDFQLARFYTRQLLLATYDMTINMQNGPVDSLKTYATLYQEITGEPQMPGVAFPASFGHLMGGYDAGYYGYLWSKVYAEDMFTVFAKAGLTDPKAGSRYRKDILERGNMEEPMSLVRRFLGREPNFTAFFKSVGAQ